MTGQERQQQIEGCAPALSAERLGAVNAKGNPPATDDGGPMADPTDRQPLIEATRVAMENALAVPAEHKCGIALSTKSERAA